VTLALELRGVGKSYPGTRAVDGVDFDVRFGEVHALLGENGAGKSTLMKIIAGSFADYDGAIRVAGAAATLHTPAQAKARGIQMIHQELNLSAPQSVAENLLAGRLPRRGGLRRPLVDRAALRAEAARCLARVGLDVDPDTAVSALAPAEAQLVEIAKALGNDPRIVVMDEPTSSLSRDEVARLFAIVQRLKLEGLAIVYISHHLPEVLTVADRMTVMRDGRTVGTLAPQETSQAQLVELMVGGAPVGAEDHPPWRSRPTRRPGSRCAASRGAGSSTTCRSRCIRVRCSGSADCRAPAAPSSDARCACRPRRRGRDRDRRPRRAPALRARRRGARARVPAGGPQDAGARVAAAGGRQRGCGGAPEVEPRPLLRRARRAAPGRRLRAPARHLPRRPDRPVGNLSGGNQQKVLLAKWLATEPRVLVLDEPTRGVDVNAKATIHAAVRALAARGAGVVLISSDLPELLALSSRIAVIRRGRLIGVIPRAGADETTLVLAANGQLPAAVSGAAA
jgi:ribose transport system ATP-binding protein